MQVPSNGLKPEQQQADVAAVVNNEGSAISALAAHGAQNLLVLNDTFSMLGQTIANPAAHGFTKVTDPVWTGNLTDANNGTLAATGSAQNKFLFFDGLPPTAAAHAQLAAGIAQGLTGVA